MAIFFANLSNIAAECGRSWNKKCDGLDFHKLSVTLPIAHFYNQWCRCCYWHFLASFVLKLVIWRFLRPFPLISLFQIYIKTDISKNIFLILFHYIMSDLRLLWMSVQLHAQRYHADAHETNPQHHSAIKTKSHRTLGRWHRWQVFLLFTLSFLYWLKSVACRWQ